MVELPTNRVRRELWTLLLKLTVSYEEFAIPIWVDDSIPVDPRRVIGEVSIVFLTVEGEEEATRQPLHEDEKVPVTAPTVSEPLLVDAIDYVVRDGSQSTERKGRPGRVSGVSAEVVILLLIRTTSYPRVLIVGVNCLLVEIGSPSLVGGTISVSMVVRPQPVTVVRAAYLPEVVG